MNQNEKRIVQRTLDLAALNGYRLTGVFDGEEMAHFPDNANNLGLSPAQFDKPNQAKALEILEGLDEGYLHFQHANVPKDRPWVYFIFGNGNNGCDVVTDHTDTDHFRNRVMNPVQALSEHLALGQATFADVLVGECFLDSTGTPWIKAQDNGRLDDPVNACVYGNQHLIKFFRDDAPVGVAPV